MNYKLITAPTTEPITLDEAKLHLRVDSDVEDTLISALIVAARQQVENTLWISLITQTWKFSLNKDEVYKTIFLSKSPQQSISHVKYFDINVIQQTLSTGGYQANILSEPAEIRLNEIPPMADIMNAMEIQFVSGFGSASDVPTAIKTAMLLLIGHWYEHREAVIVGSFEELPMGVKSLLEPYRVYAYQY